MLGDYLDSGVKGTWTSNAIYSVLSVDKTSPIDVSSIGTSQFEGKLISYNLLFIEKNM